MMWQAAGIGMAAQGIGAAVGAVGTLLDELFTSDDERLEKKVLLQRLSQQPQLAQVALNATEASHKSVFVAGWRPYIGWVLGTALALNLLVFPILSLFSVPTPVIDSNITLGLLGSMLGTYGSRSWEKTKGVARSL